MIFCLKKRGGGTGKSEEQMKLLLQMLTCFLKEKVIWDSYCSILVLFFKDLNTQLYSKVLI